MDRASEPSCPRSQGAHDACDIRSNGKPGLTVTSTMLEGNPAEVILEEADRWGADLVVVGSHGHGPVKRRVLGSVSQACTPWKTAAE